MVAFKGRRRLGTMCSHSYGKERRGAIPKYVRMDQKNHRLQQFKLGGKKGKGTTTKKHSAGRLANEEEKADLRRT